MVVSGVVMWRLRLVSRNPLSHLHLHLRADVAERVTLANTYLSLPGSEEGLGAEDRKLILDPLFRRVGTGLGTDDGMPGGLPALISTCNQRGDDELDGFGWRISDKQLRGTVTRMVTNPTDASGGMKPQNQCLRGFLTLANACTLLPKLRVVGSNPVTRFLTEDLMKRSWRPGTA